MQDERNRIEADRDELRATIAVLRAVLSRLADAADAVGVRHFDTDDMSTEVSAMQVATIAARAALATRKGG